MNEYQRLMRERRAANFKGDANPSPRKDNAPTVPKPSDRPAIRDDSDFARILQEKRRSAFRGDSLPTAPPKADRRDDEDDGFWTQERAIAVVKARYEREARGDSLPPSTPAYRYG